MDLDSMEHRIEYRVIRITHYGWFIRITQVRVRVRVALGLGFGLKEVYSIDMVRYGRY